MLSPTEIANAKFDRVMGRGYKVDEVENFLRQVASDFAAVLQEKQDIEGKLVVLADKLEEYRRDEESMRSALIGAQKLGDSVVRDAKAKANAMIDDAGGRAQLLLDNARKTIEREQIAYARMQREVAAFKSKLQHLYKQHLEMICALPSDDGILESDVSKVVPKEEPVAPPQQEFVATPQKDFSASPQLYTSPQQYSPPQQYAPPAQSSYEPEPGEESTAYDLPEPNYEVVPPTEVQEEYEPQEERSSTSYQEDFQDELYVEEKPRDSKFGTLKFGQEYSISRSDRRKK